MSLCWFLLSLTLSTAWASCGDECCPEKTVGDVHYTFSHHKKGVGHESGCSDDCIYTETAGNGTNICFAHGNLTSQCHKESFTHEMVLEKIVEEISSDNADLNAVDSKGCGIRIAASCAKSITKGLKACYKNCQIGVSCWTKCVTSDEKQHIFPKKCKPCLCKFLNAVFKFFKIKPTNYVPILKAFTCCKTQGGSIKCPKTET